MFEILAFTVDDETAVSKRDRLFENFLNENLVFHLVFLFDAN